MVEIKKNSECIKILGKKWPHWESKTLPQVIYDEDGWAVKMKYLFMSYKIIFSWFAAIVVCTRFNLL